MKPKIKDKIIRILLDQEIINEKQLEAAIVIQKKDGGRIGDILVKEKIIAPKILIAALSQHLGFPPLDINRVKLDPAIVSIVPKDVCRFYHVVPISRVGNLLTMGI